MHCINSNKTFVQYYSVVYDGDDDERSILVAFFETLNHR